MCIWKCQNIKVNSYCFKKIQVLFIGRYRIGIIDSSTGGGRTKSWSDWTGLADPDHIMIAKTPTMDTKLNAKNFIVTQSGRSTRITDYLLFKNCGL